MFSQANFKYLDSDTNSNSGYDSDNSSNSSNSSKSSNSYNSSNYSITSDPINYYRKDVLKQNYIQSLSRRKQQTQKQLELHRNKVKYNENKNNLDNTDTVSDTVSVSSIIVCREIGYNSGLDKNTPLINYLINRRINFCELGSSSHIAAFIPVVNNSRYCFIRDWKGKDCYG